MIHERGGKINNGDYQVQLIAEAEKISPVEIVVSLYENGQYHCEYLTFDVCESCKEF